MADAMFKKITFACNMLGGKVSFSNVIQKPDKVNIIFRKDIITQQRNFTVAYIYQTNNDYVRTLLHVALYVILTH